MGEKFETDFSEPPVYPALGDEREYMRSLEEREFDLRVKMFALDMAVQSLPSLITVADNEERKFTVIRRAAAEFEKILKGES